MKRRKSHQGHALWINSLSVGLLLIGIWGIGLVRFAADMPDGVAGATTRTDAIVVLTGGRGRLDAGLTLLSENRAEKLFVSGVYRGLDVRSLLHVAHQKPQGLEDRIGIGNAVNTAGNATETAVWVRQNGIRSLRLVTAAYHMPRSLLEFRHALATIKIIAHPVFLSDIHYDDWWRQPKAIGLFVSEYNKFLMAWVRHRGERLFGSAPESAPTP